MTDRKSFSRRCFLKGASVAAMAAPFPASPEGATRPGGGETFAAGRHSIQLSINGDRRAIDVEPRTTLLDALRDGLELTGTKKICDRGSCGGCTVLLDGNAVNACMLLAFDAVGHEIATIEGLSSPSADSLDRIGELHPLQAAFVECDALQCGFCTPGMVMAGIACLRKYEHPTAEQIRQEMSGNLCRCGTYGRVFTAVERTATGAAQPEERR